MTDTPIATVGDLIAAPATYDPTTFVRIATDSAEFMDYTIGFVICTPGDDDSDSDCVLPNDVPVVPPQQHRRLMLLPSRQCRRHPRVVLMPTTTTPTVATQLPPADEARGAEVHMGRCLSGPGTDIPGRA